MWESNKVSANLHFSVCSMFIHRSCEIIGNPQKKMDYFTSNYFPLCALGKVYKEFIWRKKNGQGEWLQDSQKFIDWVDKLFTMLNHHKEKFTDSNYDELSYVLRNYGKLKDIVTLFGFEISKVLHPLESVQKCNADFQKYYRSLRSMLIHRESYRYYNYLFKDYY